MVLNIRKAVLADAPVSAGSNLRLAEETEQLRLELELPHAS